MEGDLIRQRFLEFFQSKGHSIMPSASLIPAGDPTLLFTSAGMVPFKPFFMGEATPPSRRLTSSQKSFRTTDVDEVGDHKHLTFFEMLGNFSIGDYFKKQAIAFAWEFVTGEFGLAPERLYVTIYTDDDESYGYWREDIGVPRERIYRYGDTDNWWGPAGKEGPCGPCSEIHYDGGLEFGCGTTECHPNHDCERFVELWNLVFMQFYQDLDGVRTPLPAPSIDTGMGLERAAVVLQGKRNLYEIDLFQPIISQVCDLTGTIYGTDQDTDYAIRVVAEHARSAAFLIGDGVVPSNEGRGYVLRRIIRRAIRHGRRLGLEEAFLERVAGSVIERFGNSYPELETNRSFIFKVLALEEERFAQTFERGSDILDQMIRTRGEDQRRMQGIQGRADTDLATLLQGTYTPANVGADVTGVGTDDARGSRSGALEGQYIGARLYYEAVAEIIGDTFVNGAFIGPQTDPGTGPPENLDKYIEDHRQAVERLVDLITGSEAFALYDTYGFPPELTAEIALEHGLDVDMNGFQKAMQAQRERARAAHSFSGAMEIVSTYENLGIGAVEFVGYENLSQETSVAALLVDKVPVGSAVAGQQVEVVLAATPFYAEGGGQVGDCGTIMGPNGWARIEDTQSPVAGLVVHSGTIEEGDITMGEQVSARVDPRKRQDAARNHSGTHILHAALRQTLGPHVRQAGSHVAPTRLRFDFSHVSPLSGDDLLEVQGLANSKIQENLGVTTRESTFTEAVSEGALAFFGDRYGDAVRIVEMSNGERFSMEVCGGTHVAATGQIGPLFVLGDFSIGGGMRRIEAVTGQGAEMLFQERSLLLESLCKKLQTPMNDLDTRIDTFMDEMERLRRQVASLERESLGREASVLLQGVQRINGVQLVASRTSASSVDAMREMGDRLKGQLSSAAIVLGAVQEGRPVVIAMMTPDLVSRGLHAGNMVKELARVMDGGGGGRPDFAQAGGKRADKLEDAIQFARAVIERQMIP